jgi:TonB family protein
MIHKFQEPGLSMLCVMVFGAGLSLAQIPAAAKQAGQSDGVAQHLETQNPQADAESHFQKANTLREKRDVDGEIAELREAIRLNPDFPEAHLNLGLVFFQNREGRAAMKEYREAIRLKPDLPEAHLSLGIALAWTGDLNGAITEYREVTRLKPDCEEAHRNLGYELMYTGKRQEGLDELEVARKLKPELPPALSNGLLVKRVQPKYPQKARQDNIQGQVVLQAEISEKGAIDSLTLVSGDHILAPAAIEAVKQWRYKPYLINGKPIRVRTRIIVNFWLSGGIT